jgi:hypothetical protein
MTTDLVCWKCGANLTDLPQPLGRRAECTTCHAELHVCRMCRHHDAAKAKQCREPMAEEVKDKIRANYCEWFQVRPGAFAPVGPAKDDPRGALEALFGNPGANASGNDMKPNLDRLFGD